LNGAAHFALETHSREMAEHIIRFLSTVHD